MRYVLVGHRISLGAVRAWFACNAELDPASCSRQGDVGVGWGMWGGVGNAMGM